MTNTLWEGMDLMLFLPYIKKGGRLLTELCNNCTLHNRTLHYGGVFIFFEGFVCVEIDKAFDPSLNAKVFNFCKILSDGYI